MPSRAYGSEAVANWFIQKAKDTGCSDLTPMKIQKLVYFAHSWNLGVNGDPLITDEIQAWRFGPVIYQLYREFKKYHNQPIKGFASNMRYSNGRLEIHTPVIDSDDTDGLKILEKIWDVYSAYTPIQLSKMTHEEGGPWHQVASQYGGSLPSGVDIPNELIKDYYSQLAAG